MYIIYIIIYYTRYYTFTTYGLPIYHDYHM